ncbi:MAG TPA: TIM barrel protein [Candidatus Acidoferrum sp.]|nr:TIM barrel protein [Candidatus Acidoferrum sp.]
MSINRRNFLGTISAAYAAEMIAGSFSAILAAQQSPHINFPTDPRARLAVSAWAFRFIIDAPQNDERDPKLPAMDMKDFAAHVREKFNVVNIEPYNRYFRSLEPAYLDQFRNALEKSGSHAVNLAADMDTSYFDADAATRAKSVAEAKKWIDVAVTIGAPSVRTSMSSTKSAPNLDHATESLKPVADYAASKNVVVHLENDNLVAEDAFFIEKLVRKVNHPYVHALPDFGNSYGSGDPAFGARAVKALFPLAYAISHVKPTSSTAQGKEMQVDLAANFAAAKAANYKGYFSMEYEGREEIHAATANLIDQSLKLI